MLLELHLQYNKYRNCNNTTYLVLIIDKDLSAFVSQESVRPSISALNCSHASLLAGPRSPATQKSRAASRAEHFSGMPSLVFLLSTPDDFYSHLYQKERDWYQPWSSISEWIIHWFIHSTNIYWTTSAHHILG